MPTSNQDNKGQNNKSGSKSSSNGGNFKNDPERAAEAGKKGGEASRGGQSSKE